MFNAQEMDERSYLDAVLEKLQTAFENIEQKIAHYSEEIVEAKRYIYENQAQFDSAEKASNRMAVYQNIAIGEKAVLQREKLQKLIQSPYFGRIDFAVSKNSNEDVFYIGIYGFSDSESYDNIIFDWRAPVSSIFYDFEIGPAYYNAPDGRIEGALNLKRQYRIRQSQMDYMIESSLNIGDDILQKELSQNSDEKMKNIVTTIQREQNKIIRNEVAKVLIIQGVAGSGKTSIALHRVAFLLYRYKQIQYAVLAKLFSCKMTILGDSNQSVNPYSSSSAEKIRPFFKDCDCAELCKSYRSTIEIAHFAQRIQENKNLIPIERHGEIPCVSACNSQAHQFHKILDLIQIFKQSGYRSLGIICKSQKQANKLYEDIKTVHEDILLLTFTSSEFKEGIIISSAHMSKGLEYDQVIVPNVSNDCYTTEMDRSLLYVACTRAMHKLELTYYGTKTEFILS